MPIRSSRRRVAPRCHSPAWTGTRPRVLITEGDNVGVIAMVRGLARAGYDPWVAAAHRSAPALRSRATAGVAIVPDPTTSRSDFAKEIEDLASTIEPVAILPETFLVTAEEAARKPLPVTLPAIVKPPRTEVPSNGGFRTYGVRVAGTREQVIAALRSLPHGRGLLQRYRSRSGPVRTLRRSGWTCSGD